MASTKEEIVKLGEHLILAKGYNAFSYNDISSTLGIKNAAVHYHFPTKADLGVAVLHGQKVNLELLIQKVQHKDPLTKLKAFLQIYSHHKSENHICIVGSLATDLHSLDTFIEKDLKDLTATILTWVTTILQEGKETNIFVFEGSARTKALMIITNMLASLQLCRLTGDADFKKIKDTVLKDIQQN